MPVDDPLGEYTDRSLLGVKVEKDVRALLRYIGEDPDREGLRATPLRFVNAFREMTRGYGENPADILSTEFSEPCDEMVVVAGIPFWSLCEHHLMPVYGTASVAYLPRKKVVGLSKIPRLVHCFARRLQLQERMTKQIAHAMNDVLRPRGVAVLVRGEHLCMKARGVGSNGTMTTSCLLGAMKQSPSTRAEFLKLA